MDFAQLKTSLKSQVSPAYLCYGADHYLLYKAVDLVKAACPDAEVSKFDALTPVEEVLAALPTVSFFASKRLVVYQLPEKFNVTTLNNYLKNPTPDTVLLLMAFTEKNTFNLKNVVEVNCNPMPAEILVQLIAKQIAPRTITKDAAQYLVEATGGYYSMIDHELNKLLAFYPAAEVPTLQVSHLSPYLNKTVDYQIYELGSAILGNNVPQAERILQFLLAGNGYEYAVFGGVVSQLRRVYYATATTGDEGPVAKILGCSPFAIKYPRRDFGANKDAVKAKYAQSLDLEYQIKAGQISATHALASLIYH